MKMKNFNLMVFAVAGISYFNLAQAQDATPAKSVLNGQVSANSVNMTLDPFAVSEAIDQAFDSIATNAVQIAMNSLGPVGSVFSLGADSLFPRTLMPRTSLVKADSIYFFIDSLSSIAEFMPDNKVLGLLPGVYLVETTTQVTTTDVPQVADTIYSLNVGFVTSDQLSAISWADEESEESEGPLGSGPPDSFFSMAILSGQIEQYSVEFDEEVILSSSSILIVEDSMLVAPVVTGIGVFDLFPPYLQSLLDEEDDEIEFDVQFSMMHVMRLGDVVGAESQLLYDGGDFGGSSSPPEN